MEKEQKNYTPLIIIVVIMLMIISYSLFSNKRNDDNTSNTIPLSNVNINPVVETQQEKHAIEPTTDINLQEKCAKQAEIVLKNEQQRQPLYDITSTNHYNKTLNKCLMNISMFIVLENGKTVLQSSIDDAYEQKGLLNCLSGTNFTNPYCFIPGISSNTGEAVDLTTEEGEQMIKDYMNN